MPAKYLFIDDHTDQVSTESFVSIPQNAIARVGPDEVTPEMVSDASVVLVDFVVDDWREEELREGKIDPALLPGNGLALVSTLRSLGETSNLNASRSAKAFALLTGDPGKLSTLTGSQREHAIARIRDVEWIFEKPASTNGWHELERKLISLGEAVEKLPSEWPSEGGAMATTVQSLLALDLSVPWAGSAWEAVVDARAPLNELSEATHGNAFLRWLLQRALPYPGIFVDEIYLAGRLRTTGLRLRATFADKPELNALFEPAKYCGILCQFDGPHWWTAGVETILFEATGGRPYDATCLAKLVEPFNGNLTRELVVCLDENFNPDGEHLFVADDTLRVRPDDWPEFADQAYMTKETVAATPHLMGIVLADDRETSA